MESNNDKEINIALLWSHSHIWGFLVLHSLQSLSIPFTLLHAEDIQKHGIDNNIKLLIVPGGSARLKGEALGAEGLEHIRTFVQGGGNYLGFCGGCGLALSTDEGLGLCPYERSFLQDRLLHHISGNLFIDDSENIFAPKNFSKEETLLPVWFPARFAVKECENAPKVLAKYTKASPDLYMADLPQSFIDEYAQESMDLLGKYLDPQLENEPVAVHGNYGQGKYLLSYAHLETPASPYANAMLANILEDFAQIELEKHSIDNLDLNNIPQNWANINLSECRNKFEELLQLALDLRLFFERTSWLYGWTSGLPGIQFANLRMVFTFLQSIKANEKMLAKWEEIEEEFLALFHVFYEGTRSWLYARRLCISLPDTVSAHLLSDQQNRLFGEAMKMNGICGQLVDMLESVYVLSHIK